MARKEVRICVDRKRYNAKKIAAQLYLNEDTTNKYIINKCNNKQCVNPYHFQIFSKEEFFEFMKHIVVNTHRGVKRRPEILHNMKLALNKPEVIIKRSGENSKLAKLTDEAVHFIRKNYKYRDDIYKYADMFEVDESTIRSALSRKTWKHLD